MQLLESAIPRVFQLAAFPYLISLAGHSIHPHIFFESLGYAAGLFLLILVRALRGDSVAYPFRWATLAAAFVGGVAGSKILYLLEDPALTLQHIHDPAYLIGGKTIVGGLLGGLFAVEAMKHAIGFQESTGDLIALPLTVGLAIGRVGCFLTAFQRRYRGAWISATGFGGIPRNSTRSPFLSCSFRSWFACSTSSPVRPLILI